MTDAFNIDGFDFALEFFPKYPGWDGANICCWLSLHLLKLPSDIASISFIYVLRETNTGAHYWWVEQTPASISTAWEEDCLIPEQLVDVNTLNIICDIKIVDVHLKNGNCIVYEEEGCQY